MSKHRGHTRRYYWWQIKANSKSLWRNIRYYLVETKDEVLEIIEQLKK